MNVNGNRVIDNLADCFSDIENFYKNVPKGSYIADGSPARRYYDTKDRAEKMIRIAADVTGINEFGLYKAVSVARRWYERTHWEKHLPDGDADRLIEYFANYREK